ncbi:MAG: T9SS type A sorting domain-containing protein [Salibacteraceae bacterium]
MRVFLTVPFVFFTLINQLYSQNVKALDSSITIQEIISIEKNAVRLVYNTLNNRFLYSTVNGNIYEVELVSRTQKLLFDSKDHGITYMQGMAIRDSQLVVCGNINAFQPLTTGRVSLAKFEGNNSWEWKVLAETEPYKSADYFDHLFSGIVITLNGDSVIWCSGARGDHGEVQDYYGTYPNLRGLPITDALLSVAVTEDSLILKDDSTWLAQNGVLYAKGARNFFDFEYSPKGNLYALENSGDRDDPDEMNRIFKGAHYGYPWRMGGNSNPQQYLPFLPAKDKLISPFTRAMKEGFFKADSSFPKPQAGITFSEPVKNYGPHANYYRDSLSGNVQQASSGNYITTFTSHRSPLGLTFDRNLELNDTRFKGKGFMLSWTEPSSMNGIIINGTDTSIGVFSGFSEDLILIEPFQSTYDEIKCTRIVEGFNHPIDLVCTSRGLFVIESNQAAPKMYRIHFDNLNSISENSIVELNCYPNPSHGILNFSFNNYANIEGYSVVVYNMAGVEVAKQKVDAHLSIDLKNQPKGTYVIVLFNKGLELDRKKIILEK